MRARPFLAMSAVGLLLAGCGGAGKPASPTAAPSSAATAMTGGSTTDTASPQPVPSGTTGGAGQDEIDPYLPHPGEKVADPERFVAAVAVATSHARTYQIMVMPGSEGTESVFGAVDRTDPASPKVSLDVGDPKDRKAGFRAVLIRDVVYTRFNNSPDTVWRTPLKDIPAGARGSFLALLDPMDAFRAEVKGLPITFDSSLATGRGVRYSFIGAPGSGRPDYRGTYQDIAVDQHLRLLRFAVFKGARSAGSMSLSGFDENQYIEIPYGPVKDLPGSAFKTGTSK